MSSSTTTTSTTTSQIPNWNFKADYVETCNCHMVALVTLVVFLLTGTVRP